MVCQSENKLVHSGNADNAATYTLAWLKITAVNNHSHAYL